MVVTVVRIVCRVLVRRKSAFVLGASSLVTAKTANTLTQRRYPSIFQYFSFLSILSHSLSLSSSLFLSLLSSPLAAPLAACVFCDFKSTQLSRKNLCFLMKESELAARGGTRKPFRRATRQRRPMDVHVFASLTQRLGFGHQGNPNFTFGKPHDQKFKKKSAPSLKRQSIFASTITCFLV